MSAFVRLVDVMGCDAAVAAAARVSYAKFEDHDAASKEDARLIAYLATHRHMSPFRHCVVKLHCRQPEFVARQAYKHVVGIAGTESSQHVVDHAWNELSGRYVRVDRGEQWYPNLRWRGPAAAGESKQGSTEGTVMPENYLQATEVYEAAMNTCRESYDKLLCLGVCKEQARAVMPLAMMTEWYWTMSLEAAVHFCHLRRAKDAQKEIRDMAEAVHMIVYDAFPISVQALDTAAS